MATQKMLTEVKGAVSYTSATGSSLASDPRLRRPEPQMPAVKWATDSTSPTGMTNFAMLAMPAGTVQLNSPLPARLVNMVPANARISQTYWTLQNATNGAATASPLVIEFNLDAQTLVLGLVSTATGGFAAAGALEIMVDDVPLSITNHPQGIGGNNMRTLTLSWPSKAKRKLTVTTQLLSLHDMWVETGGTIAPTVAPNATKLAVVGDSWIEGTQYSPLSLGRLIPRYLGVEDIPVLGQGGTGYVSPGPGGQGKSVFGSTDRLAALVAHAPTDVLFFGSVNDDSQAAATIQAAATAAYAYLATNLSTARVHVVLPQTCGATNDVAAGHTANTAAVRSAALAAPNVTSITDTHGWLTGTGWSTVRQGDGNRDLYLGPDNVHPTQAGAHYFAQRIAEALQRWVHP